MNCKKNAIRVVVMLMSICLLVGILPLAVSAASAVELEIGSVDVDYSTGETTALVPIKVTKNDGFVSLQLDVTYDSDSMSLIGWEEGTIFPYVGSSTEPAEMHHANNCTAYSTADFMSNPFRIMYTDATATSDTTGTGTLITLKFKVTGKTGNGYPVSATVVNVLSQGQNTSVDPTEQHLELPDDITSSCSVAGGNITVSGYVTGSVDGDGVKDNNDVVGLFNNVLFGDMLAPVNYGSGSLDFDGDGTVANGDVVALFNNILFGDMLAPLH